MRGLELSQQEIKDLLEAIGDAQSELCVDLTGTRFPEGTAYYRRLDSIKERLEVAID